MHKANESDGLHAFVGENSTENAILDYEISLNVKENETSQLGYWKYDTFWLIAFMLPRKFLQEIDNLCSAFLLSGPTLSN